MTLRLFVAAPLPAETKQQIERAVVALRSALPRASWTNPESLHLTFAFLGDQNEEVIGPLGEQLASHLRGEDSFELVVAGCGFFPNEKKARVAWLGLQPHDRLARIAATTRRALKRLRLDFDDKKYVPHLTLARLREEWPRSATEEFTRRLSSFSTAPARVDRVVLYKSQLSPNGAIHTELHSVGLS